MTGDKNLRSNNKGTLTGRAALVTGAAKRVGRVLALALADVGASIVIHYKESANEARETESLIKALGVNVALVQGDLGDQDTADKLIKNAALAIGQPIDILINSASIFERATLSQTTTENWTRHQDINLRAPFMLAQTMINALPEGQFGDIININDYRLEKPDINHFAYTVSKSGLHGLTKSLALAAAPAVRVNELALGPVLAPEKKSEDYVHTKREDIPCQRFGSPDDVASAMLFLLNNQLITGQTLFLDGGLHLK